MLTLIVNKWSPRIDGLFNFGAPFLAKTSTSPGWVPGGICSSVVPSTVLTYCTLQRTTDCHLENTGKNRTNICYDSNQIFPRVVLLEPECNFTNLATIFALVSRDNPLFYTNYLWKFFTNSITHSNSTAWWLHTFKAKSNFNRHPISSIQTNVVTPLAYFILYGAIERVRKFYPWFTLRDFMEHYCKKSNTFAPSHSPFTS